MVTVVDALNFWKDYQSYEDLRDRKLGIDQTDQRNIVDLLIDQIEFATVILLNKCDLATPEDLDAKETFLQELNPFATIQRCEHGVVPLNQVLGTNSFTFEERRPLHPVRLMENLNFEDGILQNFLRSKGYCWIASRHDQAYRWSQAGVSVQIGHSIASTYPTNRQLGGNLRQRQRQRLLRQWNPYQQPQSPQPLSQHRQLLPRQSRRKLDSWSAACNHYQRVPNTEPPYSRYRIPRSRLLRGSIHARKRCAIRIRGWFRTFHRKQRRRISLPKHLLS